ncbi:hypothetical protein [Natrinema hispanicum]|uniref:Uncharacterized protein n=1 Tax=Natrinema hispanicum TaxID=392421 RepID=A0A1G6L171_9EURY|nr:hypothetical protein [Natrinema hispanicum]SDC37119.1 hypothetical protein SAMN05192552_1003158 [Natrinema hispanicum]
MSGKLYRTDLGDELATGIVSAARTSLGDTLRSVLYFTPSAFDILYLRQDLYDSTADARDAKAQLVEFEQAGFSEVPVRTAIARKESSSDIGDYEFTVRFHESGFVVRVLQRDVGVLLTIDSMDVNAFEDAAVAIQGLLHGE